MLKEEGDFNGKTILAKCQLILYTKKVAYIFLKCTLYKKFRTFYRIRQKESF